MASSQTTVQLLLGLLIVGMAHGFLQELWMYETKDYNGDNTYSGNHIYFTSNVPDSSIYPLRTVERWCFRGKWVFYSTVNYTSITFAHGGEGDNSDVECWGTTDGWFVDVYKSFRHLGPNDTTINSISLFPGRGYAGNELLVTKGAHAGIQHEIGSIAVTGGSGWLIFEGQNFDGKSVCLEGPKDERVLAYASLTDIKLNAVGSVFKGCDFPNLYVESKAAATSKNHLGDPAHLL